jgi:hypothetical protein
VRQYSDLLGQLMNVIKGFEQRLAEKSKAGNGNGGMDETAVKLQGQMALNKAKAENTSESHAQKSAQKQAAFELDQQRQDRKTSADIRRTDAVKAVETAADLRKQMAMEQNKPKESKE